MIVLVTVVLPVAGQNVTIETDQPVYALGAPVEITVHNAGPEDAEFNSSPFIAIVNLDASECIYGCVGLPVMTTFPAGATHVEDWDTGVIQDQPGHYRVTANVFMTGMPPDPPPSAEYTLVDPSPNEMRTWGAVKTLYR
ncbi:hypothetical protein KKG45_00030 [bacterium]|nr:hypothetical protein [bacterium]